MSLTQVIGKHRRPAVVSLIRTIIGETKLIRIIISVTIRIKDKEHRLRALIDLGAKANCIRRGIAVKLNLAAKERRVTPLSTQNGIPIRSY